MGSAAHKNKGKTMSLSDTPWTVGESGDVYSTEHFCVASCWNEDDAKLIAAAPDLLEFAKQVAEYAQDAECFYLMSLAESVIRKVEGKS